MLKDIFILRYDVLVKRQFLSGETLRTDEDATSGFKRIADATKNLHTFFVRPAMADSVVKSILKSTSIEPLSRT